MPSNPMQCDVCGKTLGPDERIWECTVGEVNEGAPLFEDDYFEPSEHTEHRCPACMGEELE